MANDRIDRPYLHAVLYALDVLVSVIFLGFDGETISSRAGKGVLMGRRPWIWVAPVIDWLFRPLPASVGGGPDHCFRHIQWNVGRSKDEVVKNLRMRAAGG